MAITKPTYMTFPTFKPGTSADITFHFRTYRTNGVFIENSDDHLRNFIRIELNCNVFFFDKRYGKYKKTNAECCVNVAHITRSLFPFLSLYLILSHYRGGVRVHGG